MIGSLHFRTKQKGHDLNEEQLSQDFTTQSKRLGRLNTLLIIAIVSSAVGVVLGIVSLIR